MQKHLLKIVIPETCSEELKYVVSVIFDEFWGVPYDLNLSAQAHVSISAKGSDGYVTMAKIKKASILIAKGDRTEGLDIYLDLEKL